MQKGVSIVQRLALMGILADVEEACADYGVTIAEAFADTKQKRGRSEPIVWARWTVFRALANRGWSCQAIGRAVGMHHTTVSDGLRKSFKPTKEKSPKALGPGGRTGTPTGEEQSTTPPDSGQRDFDRPVCDCGQVGCGGACQ